MKKLAVLLCLAVAAAPAAVALAPFAYWRIVGWVRGEPF
jgi:hypothetical protein